MNFMSMQFVYCYCHYFCVFLPTFALFPRCEKKFSRQKLDISAKNISVGINFRRNGSSPSFCGSEREICRQRSFRHLFQMTQTRKMSLGFWLQRFSKYFCGTFTLAFSKSSRSWMEEIIACGIGVKFSSICLCYLADFFLQFLKDKCAAYLR